MGKDAAAGRTIPQSAGVAAQVPTVAPVLWAPRWLVLHPAGDGLSALDARGGAHQLAADGRKHHGENPHQTDSRQMAEIWLFNFPQKAILTPRERYI